MKERSESLDLIRGLAALLVMVGHTRSVFFLPFSDIRNAGLFYKAFYFITGYGHECVIIFFVLSGYFVGSALHRGFPDLTHRDSSSVGTHIGNYSINRIVRLWVVLLPALFLTAVLDQVGLSAATNKSIYTTNNYFQFIPLSNDRSIWTFLGNMFFLQTIEVPTFGSNAPLWSLANEFWYYLLFPPLFLLFAKGISMTLKLMMAAVLLAILSWLTFRNVSITTGFVIWLLGFGAYVTKRRPTPVIRGVYILLFMAWMVAIRGKELPFEDLTLGLFTAAFVVAVRDLQLPGLRSISDFLSRISYTLYLIHLPIVIFLSATILHGTTLQADLQSFVIFLALFTGIIGTSYVFYYLFERNTDLVRGYLKRALRK